MILQVSSETEFIMKVTKRAVAIGGLSCLGSASLASVGQAEFAKQDRSALCKLCSAGS
jgi:hypothetical protein